MTSRDPKPDAEALMPCKGHQSGSATVANGVFGLQLVFVDKLMDERGHGRSGQSCHLCHQHEAQRGAERGFFGVSPCDARKIAIAFIG